MNDREGGGKRVLGGRYRLDSRIGSGAMGVVYRGTDLGLDRPVAIKLIHVENPDERGEAQQRFRREAKASAKLQGLNTVQIYDFGVADASDLYLVMALLEGEDLERRLALQGPPPPAETVDILIQVVRGLSEAHSHGVVHRDLKPSNIFLARTAAGPVVPKVMDFGIAGLTGSTKITRTGSLMGTPHYMSPEQAQGLVLDQRSDFYSVGIILFEMLTGRLPYQSPEQLAAWLYLHISAQPLRLSAVRPQLPQLEAFQELLDALLAKQPAQRPASCNVILETLSRIAGRLASAAAVVPPRSAIPKLLQRRPEAQTAPKPSRWQDDGENFVRYWLGAMVLAMGSGLWLYSQSKIESVHAAQDPVIRLPEVPRFVVSEAGTVHDTTTKLTWQRTLPPTYASCTVRRLSSVPPYRGDPGSVCTWAEAQRYCSRLSLAGGGWRLPTKAELLTIVDRSQIPALDSRSFPNTPTFWFWTATEYEPGTDSVSMIDFLHGHEGYNFKDRAYAVRCVR